MNRKGDPFNFDDIYQRMGADNMVKKPLVEKKGRAADHVSATSGTGTKNAVSTGATAYQNSGLSNFDFGTGPTKGNVTAPLIPKARNASLASSSQTGLDELFGKHVQPCSESTKPGQSEDPFAAFGTVEGAMPVVASAPLSSGMPTADSYASNLLGLDDQREYSSPPEVPSALPQPSQPAPPLYDAAAAWPVHVAAPMRQSTESARPDTRYIPREPSSVPSWGAPAAFPTDREHHLPVSKPAWRPSHDGKTLPQQQQQQQGPGAQPVAAHAARQSAGFGGFLKDLSKKAVRAAQSGLQSLEIALDKGSSELLPARRRGEEQYQQQYVSHGRPPAADGMERAGSGLPLFPGSQPGGTAGGGANDDKSAAEALDLALRISDLPIEVRGDALSQLPRGLRARVEEVLREQAMLEDEDSHQSRYEQAPPDHEQVIQTKEFDPLEDRHGHDSSGSWRHASEPPTSPEAAFVPAPPIGRQETEANTVGMGDEDDFFSGGAESHAHSSSVGSGGMAGTPTATATAASAQRSDWDASGGRFKPTETADLMGGFEPMASSDSAAQTSGFAPASTVPSQVHTADFMDGFDSPAADAPVSAHAPAPVRHDSINDDFFCGTSSAAPSSAAPSTAAVGGRPTNPRAAVAVDLMADLHGLNDVDLGTNQHLYESGDEGEEGEPELRRQLRAARLAEKHAKMRAALAEKLANDEDLARKKEEQVQLKDQLGEKINAWKNKNKGNIRGLIGSLPVVLWEGSGWIPIGMGDLLDSNQVKRAYMKANLLVHPDKVRQKHGTPEQVAIADMVFDVLKDAWTSFKP